MMITKHQQPISVIFSVAHSYARKLINLNCIGYTLIILFIYHIIFYLNYFRFRDCVKWIKQKYFQGTEQRAEFFPVDWRSQCSFDGGNYNVHNTLKIT